MAVIGDGLTKFDELSLAIGKLLKGLKKPNKKESNRQLWLFPSTKIRVVNLTLLGEFTLHI